VSRETKLYLSTELDRILRISWVWQPNVTQVWSTLSLLAVLAAQSTDYPKLIVPDVPDLTIRTRQTTDQPNSSISTEVIYLKGARQRREWILEWPASDEPAHVSTTIVQCDERRTLVLNHEARTYAYSTIEDISEYLRRLGPTRRESLPPETPTRSDVTITFDAVDTGERRRIGRYIARRVVSTRKVEPGPDAQMPASVDEQDGWYVDLPSPNCGGPEMQARLVVGYSGSDTRDRVHVKELGTARRGYPIEEIHRTQSGTGTSVTKLELIEFSDAPLDSALFTIPKTYRPALPLLSGGYDLSRPDTLRNRLRSYWEGLVALANDLFTR
jgi:hypothetical protein